MACFSDQYTSLLTIQFPLRLSPSLPAFPYKWMCFSSENMCPSHILPSVLQSVKGRCGWFLWWRLSRGKLTWNFIKWLSSICASNPGKYVLLRLNYCLEGYQVNIWRGSWFYYRWVRYFLMTYIWRKALSYSCYQVICGMGRYVLLSGCLLCLVASCDLNDKRHCHYYSLCWYYVFLGTKPFAFQDQSKHSIEGFTAEYILSHSPHKIQRK